MALSTSVGKASRGRRGWSQVYSQPQETELAMVLGAISDRVSDVGLRARVKKAVNDREKLSDDALRSFNNYVSRGSSLDKEVRRITGSTR
jgi:hypothetical protein